MSHKSGADDLMCTVLRMLRNNMCTEAQQKLAGHLLLRLVRSAMRSGDLDRTIRFMSTFEHLTDTMLNSDDKWNLKSLMADTLLEGIIEHAEKNGMVDEEDAHVVTPGPCAAPDEHKSPSMVS